MAESESRFSHGARRITGHPILGEARPTEQVTFLFDDETLQGLAGEPLLAALLASGVRVVHTMPELGDPRGGYCLVGRCADCQMVVDGVPGVRACVTPLRPGMVVRTQYGLGGDSLVLPGDEQ